MKKAIALVKVLILNFNNAKATDTNNIGSDLSEQQYQAPAVASTLEDSLAGAYL